MYIEELQERGLKTRNYRLSSGKFLEVNSVEGWDEIGEHIEQMEKYAHIYAPKLKIDEIFEFLDALNHDAYLCSKFAFRRGASKTATLTAHKAAIENKSYLELELARKDKSQKTSMARYAEKIELLLFEA